MTERHNLKQSSEIKPCFTHSVRNRHFINRSDSYFMRFFLPREVQQDNKIHPDSSTSRDRKDIYYPCEIKCFYLRGDRNRLQKVNVKPIPRKRGPLQDARRKTATLKQWFACWTLITACVATPPVFVFQCGS